MAEYVELLDKMDLKHQVLSIHSITSLFTSIPLDETANHQKMLRREKAKVGHTDLKVGENLRLFTANIKFNSLKSYC